MTAPKTKEVYFLVEEDTLYEYGDGEGLTREELTQHLNEMGVENAVNLSVIRGTKVALKVILDT